jgi:hypothetical protein
MKRLTKKQYAAIVAKEQESCAYNGITNPAAIQRCIDNTVSNHLDFYKRRNEKRMKAVISVSKVIALFSSFIAYDALMIYDSLHGTGGLGILISCIVGCIFLVMLGVHIFTGATRFAGFKVFTEK